MSPRPVVVEADGGSRGNPGPAAYGAVLRDAETGAVLAEDAEALGVATNNVAEYSGLIAGLRLATELAPGADVEVRMDSKLVVEQMSGRWKIKHTEMRMLATRAAELAPPGTAYTWVPRERNGHADRLVNDALDGVRSGVRTTESATSTEPESLIEQVESPAPAPVRGWSGGGPAPTTLILVRHGVTEHTAAKRFSGGLASADPPLSDAGREQVRLTAQWLAPGAARIDAVLASPVLRTLQSAEILAEVLAEVLGHEVLGHEVLGHEVLGHEVLTEPGFAEMEFGAWDGLTFAEVAERDQAGLDAWLGSLDVPPPGGESFRTVQARVLHGLDRVLAEHAGQTVVVLSHVTPIKTLVARAVGAPLGAVFTLELTPASVSVVSFHPDEAADGGFRGSLRLFNALPPGRDGFGGPGSSW